MQEYQQQREQEQRAQEEQQRARREEEKAQSRVASRELYKFRERVRVFTRMMIKILPMGCEVIGVWCTCM